MTVPGTSITYNIRPTTGASVHGSETEFALTPATTPVSYQQMTIFTLQHLKWSLQ